METWRPSAKTEPAPRSRETQPRPSVDTMPEARGRELRFEHPERLQSVDGRYQNFKHLGEGGHGAIFHADRVRDPITYEVEQDGVKKTVTERFDDKVIIKALRPDAPHQIAEGLSAEREALLGEGARVVPTDESSYIITLLDVTEIEDPAQDAYPVPAIVLKDLGIEDEGVIVNDMFEELRSDRAVDGHLPVPVVTQAFDQLCLALDTVHRSGRLHRDVKEQNILMVHRGGGEVDIRLIDFGISQKIGSAEKGTVSGTATHMAPESLLEQPQDERTDLYSLGVTMYEVLSGHWPYGELGEEETNYQVAVRVIAEEAIDLKDRNIDGISDRLSELVMTLLSKDPSKRLAFPWVSDVDGLSPAMIVRKALREAV